MSRPPFEKTAGSPKNNSGDARHSERRSYVYALIAILFWSTVPTAFKISLKELDILTMLTIASVTSTLALFLSLIAEGKTRLLTETSGRDILNSSFFGLINPFIYYIILLKAYSLLPAQVAQPLNMIWPIVLVFLSVPMLKQKIPSKSFLALFISFAGVYVISSQGNLFRHTGSNTTGVLLATGSSVLWAFYFILNMKDGRDEAVKLFLNFCAGSIYLIVAMIITQHWQNGISFKGLISSVYVGLFVMGITFLFWLKALQLAKSTDKISNLVYVAPFISLIFVHFLLNEHVYITTLAGLLLIITGIFIQNHKQTSK
jgi:drug/metabolite transporter (DMT)-like permease